MTAVAFNPDPSDGRELGAATTDANGNFAVAIDHRPLANSTCTSCHNLTPAAMAGAQRRIAASLVTTSLLRAALQMKVAGGMNASELDGSMQTNISALSALITLPASSMTMTAARTRSIAQLTAIDPNTVEVNPLTTMVDTRTKVVAAQKTVADSRKVASRAQQDLVEYGLVAAYIASIPEIEGLYALKTDPETLKPDFTVAGLGTDAGNLAVAIGTLDTEDASSAPAPAAAWPRPWRRTSPTAPTTDWTRPAIRFLIVTHPPLCHRFAGAVSSGSRLSAWPPLRERSNMRARYPRNV